MGKLREFMEQWLEEGLRDFKLAKRFKGEGLYHVSVFFAQQAAEKALKALYYVGRKLHPRTHDLERLFQMLPLDALIKKPGFTLRELRILTDYYEKSRYPDVARGLPSEKITVEDANEALAIAEKVIRYAMDVVNSVSIEDPDVEAIEVARHIVGLLRERGLRVRRAYVFGSRVRGDWHELSDLDLVIVSDDFKGLRDRDRLKLVLNAIEGRVDNGYRINFFLYTVNEFEEALKGGSVALADASRYWVDLLEES